MATECAFHTGCSAAYPKKRLATAAPAYPCHPDEPAGQFFSSLLSLQSFTPWTEEVGIRRGKRAWCSERSGVSARRRVHVCMAMCVCVCVCVWSSAGRPHDVCECLTVTAFLQRDAMCVEAFPAERACEQHAARGKAEYMRSPCERRIRQVPKSAFEIEYDLRYTAQQRVCGFVCVPCSRERVCAGQRARAPPVQESLPLSLAQACSRRVTCKGHGALMETREKTKKRERETKEDNDRSAQLYSPDSLIADSSPLFR